MNSPVDQLGPAVPQRAHGYITNLLNPGPPGVFVAQDFVRTVIRSIVQHDQLGVSVAIHCGQNGVQAAAHMLLGVEHRDHHGKSVLDLSHSLTRSCMVHRRIPVLLAFWTCHFASTLW